MDHLASWSMVEASIYYFVLLEAAMVFYRLFVSFFTALPFGKFLSSVLTSSRVFIYLFISIHNYLACSLNWGLGFVTF
jgi:hypothetical protein